MATILPGTQTPINERIVNILQSSANELENFHHDNWATLDKINERLDSSANELENFHHDNWSTLDSIKETTNRSANELENFHHDNWTTLDSIKEMLHNLTNPLHDILHVMHEQLQAMAENNILQMRMMIPQVLDLQGTHNLLKEQAVILKNMNREGKKQGTERTEKADPFAGIALMEQIISINQQMLDALIEMLSVDKRAAALDRRDSEKAKWKTDAEREAGRPPTVGKKLRTDKLNTGYLAGLAIGTAALAAVVGSIMFSIDQVLRPLSGLLFSIKKIFSREGKLGKWLASFVGIFNKLPVIGPIARALGAIGVFIGKWTGLTKIVGKWIPFLAPFFLAWDTITGFMKGWQKHGTFIEGLKGVYENIYKEWVVKPLTLLVNFLGQILKFMGLKQLGQALIDFDLEKAITAKREETKNTRNMTPRERIKDRAEVEAYVQSFDDEGVTSNRRPVTANGQSVTPTEQRVRRPDTVDERSVTPPAEQRVRRPSIRNTIPEPDDDQIDRNILQRRNIERQRLELETQTERGRPMGAAEHDLTFPKVWQGMQKWWFGIEPRRQPQSIIPPQPKYDPEALYTEQVQNRIDTIPIKAQTVILDVGSTAVTRGEAMITTIIQQGGSTTNISSPTNINQTTNHTNITPSPRQSENSFNRAMDAMFVGGS